MSQIPIGLTHHKLLALGSRHPAPLPVESWTHAEMQSYGKEDLKEDLAPCSAVAGEHHSSCAFSIGRGRIFHGIFAMKALQEIRKRVLIELSIDNLAGVQIDEA